MINVSDAIKASQAFNRDMWLKHAGDKLSNQIMSVAKTGIRELNVCFKDLIVGAENLNEAGEMLLYVNSILEKSGFKHKITENGNLYISW